MMLLKFSHFLFKLLKARQHFCQYPPCREAELIRSFYRLNASFMPGTRLGYETYTGGHGILPANKETGNKQETRQQRGSFGSVVSMHSDCTVSPGLNLRCDFRYITQGL